MSLALAALLACGTPREATAPVAAPATPTPSAPTPANDAEATGPDTWTVGVVDVPALAGPGVTVVDVRSGGHEGFDRIVLEFKGDRVPGHHVEYVDRPARDCTKGEPLEIEGDGLLLVQLQPASGHDDAGNATTPKEAKPGLPVVREIERACDFEGVVAFVVGVGAPNPYRAFELSSPARLVIDVRR